MNRGVARWGRLLGIAALALFVVLELATFGVGGITTRATADTVPCFDPQGNPIPCPTTTLPPPTTQPPTTQPPTTAPPATHPPTTVRPPVTSPPETNPTPRSFATTPPPTVAPPPAAPPTTAAPATTAPPGTAPLTPPAILGGFNDKAQVTTTTPNPSSPPSSSAVAVAVGLPHLPGGHHLSPRFIYAIVLDGLLLMGLSGYVIVRRLHLI